MIFTACLLHKSATFLQLFDTLICATDFVNLANQWYEIDTEFFSVLYTYVRQLNEVRNYGMVYF